MATRAQIRKSNRLQRRIAITLLAGLFASGGAAVMIGGTDGVAYGSAGTTFDTTRAITASQLVQETTPTAAASRSAVREGGSWTLGDSNGLNTTDMTAIHADNPTVRDLINHRDKGQYPTNLDPDHATGDNGNQYAYSQCTWWAYKRRHELNLPAGSRMGNGRDWADSARRLGYWVDTTPRVGDVMVFKAGQDGSSPIYGHVAIVETVNEDGSITTSECGAAYHGKPFSRTFTAQAASQHQFIHY